MNSLFLREVKINGSENKTMKSYTRKVIIIVWLW